MLITRKADYAVRAVLYLALWSEEGPTPVASLARAAEVPEAFMAKILQVLARRGIVTSERGVQGGFRLARDPAAISLLEVLEAVQGRLALNECVTEGHACHRSGTCAVHPIWAQVRHDVEDRLLASDFATLAARTATFGGSIFHLPTPTRSDPWTP